VRARLSHRGGAARRNGRPPRLRGRERPLSYDPFSWGCFGVETYTLEAVDARRDRRFACEIWQPSSDGRFPLIAFSHASGGDRRRQSTFLCTHLASHGYVVAALDHSETFVPELARSEGETAAERAARIDRWIANRVPDVRLLLDYLLVELAGAIDAARVGLVGHSFGGWTVLATPESDARVRSIVALAPGGSSHPPPNIIPAKLAFAWSREIATLLLVAEDDTALPLEGMHDIFERAPSPKRMAILRHADHAHFMDRFDAQPGQCSREHAHLFTRSLTLAHFDATLKEDALARGFFDADIERALAARGIDAYVHEPVTHGEG
jgi:predicted dienelactone hydrolase